MRSAWGDLVTQPALSIISSDSLRSAIIQLLVSYPIVRITIISIVWIAKGVPSPLAHFNGIIGNPTSS